MRCVERSGLVRLGCVLRRARPAGLSRNSRVVCFQQRSASKGADQPEASTTDRRSFSVKSPPLFDWWYHVLTCRDKRMGAKLHIFQTLTKKTKHVTKQPNLMLCKPSWFTERFHKPAAAARHRHRDRCAALELWDGSAYTFTAKCCYACLCMLTTRRWQGKLKTCQRCGQHSKRKSIWKTQHHRCLDKSVTKIGMEKQKIVLDADQHKYTCQK